MSNFWDDLKKEVSIPYSDTKNFDPTTVSFMHLAKYAKKQAPYLKKPTDWQFEGHYGSAVELDRVERSIAICNEAFEQFRHRYATDCQVIKALLHDYRNQIYNKGITHCDDDFERLINLMDIFIYKFKAEHTENSVWAIKEDRKEAGIEDEDEGDDSERPDK